MANRFVGHTVPGKARPSLPPPPSNHRQAGCKLVLWATQSAPCIGSSPSSEQLPPNIHPAPESAVLTGLPILQSVYGINRVCVCLSVQEVRGQLA